MTLWVEKVLIVLILAVLCALGSFLKKPKSLRSRQRLHQGHTVVKRFWPETELLTSSLTSFNEMVKEAEVLVAVKMKAKTVIFQKRQEVFHLKEKGYMLILCVQGEHHELVFQRKHVPAHHVFGWPPFSKEHKVLLSCGDALIFGREEQLVFEAPKEDFILLEFSGQVMF
jgi:hypothetical protein